MGRDGEGPDRAAAPSPARLAAVRALLAVERGADPREALDRALADRSLDPRDRALATELVYGTTRWRGTLDRALAGVADRPLERLPAAIRQVLRLAAYQVLVLERVPARAAVHQAVELARRFGHEGTARYVNAVLRALLRSPDPLRLPDPERDPAAYLAVRHAHPEWLVRRYLARLGREATEALLAANNAAPALGVRVNPLRADAPRVADALARAGLQVEPGRWLDGALRVRGGLTPRRWPGFDAGWFTVQDEGSMLPALVLSPEPGDRVLDACAAPGTKSGQLAERMADRGEVLAVDVDQDRLARVAENARRLGLRSIRTLAADARRLGAMDGLGTFDRALVDAPCTGLGTLARRPDLRWRRREEDVALLSTLQREILLGVAERLRPGGVLVYSTCTTEPEENRRVVEAFLASRPDFRPEPLRPHLPPRLREWLGGRLGPDDWDLQLWPHLDGCDGFYLARLVRAEAGDRGG